MEYWDIYDADKKVTGRTMKRNDWCLKDGEYHLTVLGVIARKDGTFLITKRVMTKAWAPGWWEVSGGAAQAGETSEEAVRREVKEETGLDFSPLMPDPLYERPFFTSVGMTDESCATVYGYASGQISREGLEDTEDLEVVLADRTEVHRILKEERVAIMCAYMLMHFLKEDEPFGFLQL